MDVTPLLGPGSGVARAVRGWWDAASSTGEVDLVGWTTSWRDRSGAGVDSRSVPLPAVVAVPMWRRFDRPRLDRLVGRPDLLHATNHVAPGASAPRLLTVMDLSFVLDPEDVTAGVERFDATIRAAVDRGVRLHTISHHIAEGIEAHYGVSATVVAPVVEAIGAGPADTAGDPPARDRREPVVLAIGNQVRRKRFPLLVEAFGRLAADLPRARLVLVGAEGSDTAAIHDAVERLPTATSDRIELLGRRPDDEIAAWVDRATVLAHPSGYEGFGLPVLEAMAAGLPVVAAAAGAVVEAAGDAATIVPVDDVDRLAAGLVELLTDDELWERRQRDGRQRAAAFSPELIGAELVAVYRELV